MTFPVPYVDSSEAGEVTDYEKLTVLEAPHRLADAVFRDSLLEGTLFRLSDVGRAITDATPRNATDLFRYSPTSLLFGMWDSTGPKGGLGSKFQRAYVSEIVGFDASVGKKVGSRIDPLQIERGLHTLMIMGVRPSSLSTTGRRRLRVEKHRRRPRSAPELGPKTSSAIVCSIEARASTVDAASPNR